MSRSSKVLPRGWLLLYLFLLSPSGALAQEIAEDDVQKKVAEAGEDQDEEIELLDEFTFLEDAGMVELAARHRQEIGMSPSAVTVLTRKDVAPLDQHEHLLPAAHRRARRHKRGGGHGALAGRDHLAG